MTQVQQDLEAAYDVLEAKGWCQGWGQTRDGRVCLEGALAQATMGDASLWATLRDGPRADATDALTDRYADATTDRYADATDALTARLPRDPGDDWPHLLYLWNDRPSTTFEMVKDLIKGAIKVEAEK